MFYDVNPKNTLKSTKNSTNHVRGEFCLVVIVLDTAELRRDYRRGVRAHFLPALPLKEAAHANRAVVEIVVATAARTVGKFAFGQFNPLFLRSFAHASARGRQHTQKSNVDVYS